MNIDVVDAAADDDNCAKLDRDDADELIDIFGDCRHDTVSTHLLRDMRKANDLTQLEATSAREEDTTNNINLEVSDFQFNPPPSQRRRLSIDPHEIHYAHVQF